MTSYLPVALLGGILLLLCCGCSSLLGDLIGVAPFDELRDVILRVVPTLVVVAALAGKLVLDPSRVSGLVLEFPDWRFVSRLVAIRPALASAVDGGSESRDTWNGSLGVFAGLAVSELPEASITRIFLSKPCVAVVSVRSTFWPHPPYAADTVVS